MDNNLLAAIKINDICSHVELRSWFEFDGEQLIGMGSKKTFSGTGKLIEYEESPTGIVINWDR